MRRDKQELAGGYEQFAVDQGEIRKKHNREENPTSGKMKLGNGIGESEVANNHEGRDSKKVPEKHDGYASKICGENSPFA